MLPLSGAVGRAAVVSVRTKSHSPGGVQVHLEYVLDALEALGWEGDVLTSALPGRGGGGERKAFRIHYLEKAEPGIHGRRWWAESRRAFLMLHESRPFDLILSEGYSGWSIARIPAGLRPPLIYWNQGFEPEHLLNRWHDVDQPAEVLSYLFIKAPEVALFTYVEWDCIRRAERVVVPASHIWRRYRRYYRVTESKFVSIPNWVDVERFTPDSGLRETIRQKMGWEDGSAVALMAAVLSRQKGIQVGLKALARCRREFPGLRIAVAGDGPYLEELRRLAGSVGLGPMTRWLGHQEEREMAGLYAAADLFVMPTLRQEGMSFTVLEAMAGGLPILAFDRGGNAETLGDAGILIRAGDADLLAEELRRLLHDPKLRLELGERARRRAESLFSRHVAQPKLGSLIWNLRRSAGDRKGWGWPMRSAFSSRQNRHAWADLPLVSICIPTHNRGRMLAECIDSILGQGYPRERLEILVFDDASSPEEFARVQHTFERLRAAGFWRLHLVRSERNVKMLVGRQTLSGAASAESEFFLFLDDDGTLERDTLHVLVESARENARIAAVGPRIVAAIDCRKVLHSAFFMNPWSGLYTMRDAEEATLCDWLNSTCLLVRKQALGESGGFDVSFGQSQAEADLCLRLKTLGYGVLYQPRATAFHKVMPGDVRRERLYYLYRNKFWVIRKHFRGLPRMTALALHLLLGTPRHLAESVWFNQTINRQEWKAILRAAWDGLFS